MPENIDNIFLQYKNKLIKKYGRKALYSDKIDEIGKDLFKTKWIGCYPQDKVKFKKGFQIINNHTSKQAGEHWISIYITKNMTVYIYDSFGRKSEDLLPILIKKIKNKNMKWKDSKNDVEQYTNSDICGCLCLAWLKIVDIYGIKQAIKI